NPLLELTQSQREAFEMYTTAFDMKGLRRFGQPFTRPCGEVDVEEAERTREMTVEAIRPLKRKDTTEKWVQAAGYGDSVSGYGRLAFDRR
ncbi:MAG: hypothetical protein IJ994_06520, partial [Firmicutes bacterium]|nr:hypothetical protein [Bacillota bacterium]